MWAASRGLDQEVEDILQRAVVTGCLPGLNASDSSGRTAGSYLCGNGSTDLLELLLNFDDIDLTIPDNEGNTPLHFASQAGQHEAVSLLITKIPGLEIDGRNILGFTSLMKAAIQGRTKCAKLLLLAGACATLRDHGRGLRAEEWARYCGRHVTADLIAKQARGALLSRESGGGRWGSDPELCPHLVGGILLPPRTPSVKAGLTARLKKALRPSKPTNYNLVTQLSTAAFCASSPVLPGPSAVPPVVKSLIRPLSVPKVQVTSAEQPTDTVKQNKKK